MFDGRDIQLWTDETQLNIRNRDEIPVSFLVNDNGRLVVTSSEDIAQTAQYIVNEEAGTVEVKYLKGQGRAFDIHIERWLPKFILRDKNGYAIAKAIEAGLNMMNTIVQEGVQNLIDVNCMPEWALDEKAWEYNIIYDYSAPVETKRGWVRDAFTMHSLYGTPAGIIKYLEPYFDNATVQEWWEYEASPYHFRVVLAAERTAENDAWAHKAINQVKNVRSILDLIIYNSYESAATGSVGAATVGMEIVDTSREVTE